MESFLAEAGLRTSSLAFFFSSRMRHTRCYRDWSSDVCSSDLDDLRRKRNIAPLRIDDLGDEVRIVGDRQHGVVIEHPLQQRGARSWTPHGEDVRGLAFVAGRRPVHAGLPWPTDRILSTAAAKTWACPTDRWRVSARAARRARLSRVHESSEGGSKP